MATKRPTSAKSVRKRKSDRPSEKPASYAVKLAEFEHAKGSDLVIRQDDRLTQLFAAADSEGLSQPYRPVPDPVKLTRSRLKKKRLDKKLAGQRPGSATLRFSPKRAKPPRPPQRPDGKQRDQGGTIFGSDDRYLFFDRSFPWRITGQVRTAAGRCSGTMIGPRHVLTASHCVNWANDGSAGWISFSPSYFDGDRPWGEFWATQVVFWIRAPGRLTDDETGRDYAVLILEERIGDVIGYAGARTYNSAWNGGSFWQYVGYPGERASGERPAFQGDCVVSSTQSQSGGGVVLGHFNEFTPGQSGGAAWGWWGREPWPRVVGVGSTIGSTAVVQNPTGSTNGDNEYGGGEALTDLIAWSRANFP